MATLNIKNFPDDLYQQLKERAELNHRSVAQEVTHLLKQNVANPPRRSVLELEGLGAHVWKGIDSTKYIEEERNSWE
ncbi:MAG: FitA-like ribbon-helix-helix domain-containing protein [Gemmatimonas sp.]